MLIDDRGRSGNDLPKHPGIRHHYGFRGHLAVRNQLDITGLAELRLLYVPEASRLINRRVTVQNETIEFELDRPLIPG